METRIIITDINRSTPDSVTLFFEQPDERFIYFPGQHIAITAPVDGEPVTRTYSFNSAPFLDKLLAITIKRVAGGRLSNYLIDEAKIGLSLVANGPLGDFYTLPNESNRRHLLLFAGGSGITPLLSIAKSVLHGEPHTHVSLVYANRSAHSIILLAELEQLVAQYPDRFALHHALDEPAADGSDPVQVTFRGSLSRLVVRKWVSEQLGRYDYPVSEFYLCGPFGFMELVREGLEKLGIDSEMIHQEHFFVPQTGVNAGINFRNLPQQIILIRVHGIEQPLLIPTGKSILDAGLEAGLSLPYSCREAQCGSCRSWLRQGRVELERNHILTTEELAAGQVLLCRGFPMDDSVIVEPILTNW